jgi:hypothetical protein
MPMTTPMARMAVASVATATKASSRQDGMGRHLMAAALSAACVWLMVQAATYGLRDVLPPEAGLKLAPRSPDALNRAAEAFQAEGRDVEAGALARYSIALAPFDSRALRILGLAIAKKDADLADRLLTLAGDWSLRDVKIHTWLMLRRARQGQAASVLAHADLMVRQWPELYGAIFPVFDALTVEPGGAQLVAERLAFKPDWRPTYFVHLAKRQLSTGVALARALKVTAAPPAPDELAGLYSELILQKRYADLVALERTVTDGAAPPLRDGGFPTEGQPPPLGWWFTQAPGFDAQVVSEGGPGQGVFVLHHDGFTAGVAARQVLILPQGLWRFSGRVRWAGSMPAHPPIWSFTCLGGGGAPALALVVPTGTAGQWSDFSTNLAVPQDCLAQHIELIAQPGERRQEMGAAFDDFRIVAQ